MIEDNLGDCKGKRKRKNDQSMVVLEYFGGQADRSVTLSSQADPSVACGNLEELEIRLDSLQDEKPVSRRRKARDGVVERPRLRAQCVAMIGMADGVGVVGGKVEETMVSSWGGRGRKGWEEGAGCGKRGRIVDLDLVDCVVVANVGGWRVC